MDTGLLTFLGIVIVEAAGLIALWIKVERSRRSNGDATRVAEGHVNTRVDQLREQVLQELVVVRQEREMWQLRALQCEEEQRRRLN